MIIKFEYSLWRAFRRAIFVGDWYCNVWYFSHTHGRVYTLLQGHMEVKASRFTDLAIVCSKLQISKQRIIMFALISLFERIYQSLPRMHWSPVYSPCKGPEMPNFRILWCHGEYPLLLPSGPGTCIDHSKSAINIVHGYCGREWDLFSSHCFRYHKLMLAQKAGYYRLGGLALHSSRLSLVTIRIIKLSDIYMMLFLSRWLYNPLPVIHFDNGSASVMQSGDHISNTNYIVAVSQWTQL